MTCTVCGDLGFVYRADIEAGHATWKGSYVECPICYLKTLTGAQ